MSLRVWSLILAAIAFSRTRRVTRMNLPGAISISSCVSGFICVQSVRRPLGPDVEPGVLVGVLGAHRFAVLLLLLGLLLDDSGQPLSALATPLHEQRGYVCLVGGLVLVADAVDVLGLDLNLGALDVVVSPRREL